MPQFATKEIEIGQRPRGRVETQEHEPPAERPYLMPIVLAGSVALHGAVLALAGLLPGPSVAIAPVLDELSFTVVEPEPEPVVEPEPEPEPPPAAQAPRPTPRARPEPPPPPAPVLTATEAATVPSEWSHPEGEEGGSLDGVPGGTGTGEGDPIAEAASEATEERRGLSRAELRRRLIGYIRGPLSRYIAERTSYPIAARREHLQGVVVLRLRLDAQGNVLGVRLSRSSGHSMLDDAALASVRDMNTMPAPPSELPWDETQELPLPVTYRLQ